jgi:spore germination protein YaaH
VQTKKRTSLVLGAILVLFIGFFCIFWVIKTIEINQNNSTNTTSITPTDRSISLSPTQVPKLKLEYNGWIPNWASTSGLDSLKNNSELYTSISPVWYEVNENGSLKKTFPSNRAQIIEYAKQQNIKLYPAIAMFDHEIFTKVLQSEENLSRHINEILTEAKSYDGIDLDYESTKLSDKEKYFEFISRLSEGLKSSGKKLMITVIAKWGDAVLYPSLPETRQVQDWERLSKYADEIRIMAYDFTFSKSHFPGPIAPLSWVHDCLTYALTKIPAEKIVLGIHLYSYEWSTDSKIPYDFIVDMSANQTGNVAAASYNYTQVKAILSSHKGETTDFDNESIFRYEESGKKKTLVYQTPEQLQKRIDQAKEFNIKGVVFWRLGGDDNLLKQIY